MECLKRINVIKPSKGVDAEVEILKDEMKILVPHDGSEHADKALTEAVDIAKRFSGAITVLHVYHNPRVEEDQVRGQSDLKFLNDVEEHLKDAEVRHEIRVEHFKFAFIENSAPVVILKVAEEEDFDLLAMGGKGLGGKGWLLGSVASKLVSGASCNILLAK